MQGWVRSNPMHQTLGPGATPFSAPSTGIEPCGRQALLSLHSQIGPGSMAPPLPGPSHPPCPCVLGLEAGAWCYSCLALHTRCPIRDTGPRATYRSRNLVGVVKLISHHQISRPARSPSWMTAPQAKTGLGVEHLCSG